MRMADPNQKIKENVERKISKLSSEFFTTKQIENQLLKLFKDIFYVESLLVEYIDRSDSFKTQFFVKLTKLF
jgi:hypothetical protein